MLIEKLWMLANSYISIEQKLFWFQMWNESIVLKEIKKFPKPYFSNSNLTSGCTKQASNIKYYTSKCYFFIFHFFLKILLLIHFCFCNLRLKCSSHSMQQSLIIFFWLWKRSQIWSLFPHIYNNGGWWYGTLSFSKSSNLRMGSEEANIGSNNLRARRLSNGCCTSIPTCLVFHSIIIFHYVFNLWQIIF